MSQPNTPATCIKHCKEKGEPFAVVKRELCYCRDTELGTTHHYDNKCDATCPGDEKQICGGMNSYANIYETKGEYKKKHQ